MSLPPSSEPASWLRACFGLPAPAILHRACFGLQGLPCLSEPAILHRACQPPRACHHQEGLPMATGLPYCTRPANPQEPATIKRACQYRHGLPMATGGWLGLPTPAIIKRACHIAHGLPLSRGPANPCQLTRACQPCTGAGLACQPREILLLRGPAFIQMDNIPLFCLVLGLYVPSGCSLLSLGLFKHRQLVKQRHLR